jgi:hypothetical protein
MIIKTTAKKMSGATGGFRQIRDTTIVSVNSLILLKKLFACLLLCFRRL